MTDPTRNALICESHAIRELGATLIGATDIGSYAVEYAVRGWAVLPLNGKLPAVAGGRGVLDATVDVAQVSDWWGGRYRGCNIGARVPAGMVVIDVDPRNGGADSIEALTREHGPLPLTLRTMSGRGDGGSHRFYRRPAGKLSSRRLGPGIDLKNSAGYVVVPPSVHPDSGQPYRLIDRPVVAAPEWLIGMMRPEQIEDRPRPRAESTTFLGASPADQFSSAASWSEILEPHGWRCIDAEPDADGSRWRHPAATSPWSGTIKNGCLFVYSPNTPFDVTESSNPHGYTRFRAYAVLDHAGDLKAAARYISKAVA